MITQRYGKFSLNLKQLAKFPFHSRTVWPALSMLSSASSASVLNDADIAGTENRIESG